MRGHPPRLSFERSSKRLRRDRPVKRSETSSTPARFRPHQIDKHRATQNTLLHFRPYFCYKQFTESGSVASRSYCLQLSGSSGI
jgi:hypothetical protein